VLGEGGEQNAPLGRAVIGGLLFATVATLIFVPAVFALLHGRETSASTSPRASSWPPSKPPNSTSSSRSPRPTSRARRPTSTSPTPPPTATQNLLKLNSVSSRKPTLPSQAQPPNARRRSRRGQRPPPQQLQSFEKVYAPYSGIVTQRNTDIGDLINAGSSTAKQHRQGALPHRLVNQLRVFVAVPEVYAPDIHNGDTATLTLDEYPGQIFTGIVTRNSGSIDPASRTLNVEVDVNNHNEKLLPGAYVFVHFKIPVQSRELPSPPTPSSSARKACR
jgi:biotin carboxyl carrier protein